MLVHTGKYIVEASSVKEAMKVAKRIEEAHRSITITLKDESEEQVCESCPVRRVPILGCGLECLSLG